MPRQAGVLLLGTQPASWLTCPLIPCLQRSLYTSHLAPAAPPGVLAHKLWPSPPLTQAFAREASPEQGVSWQPLLGPTTPPCNPSCILITDAPKRDERPQGWRFLSVLFPGILSPARLWTKWITWHCSLPVPRQTPGSKAAISVVGWASLFPPGSFPVSDTPCLGC